jgi:hypothetical protein
VPEKQPRPSLAEESRGEYQRRACFPMERAVKHGHDAFTVIRDALAGPPG